jgi:lipopolysaccharide transport system permease protein
LWFLTTREIKGRYRQMALGPLWMVLRPLMTMVVFTVIFGHIAKLPSNGIPYPLFTFTALISWTYFATAVDGASRSLVTQIGLISKVYFPRLVIPIAASIAGLVDLGFAFLVLIGLMAWYGQTPTWWAAAIPFYLLFTMLTALAIGLWSATAAVRFRDLQYAVAYILQIWLYATPIAYSASLIPQSWQLVYKLNPLYWVVAGFRYGLLDEGVGPKPMMLIPFAAVIILLVSGAYVFRRTERSIVDLQ